MSRLLPCTSWVCWSCMLGDVPGCSACFDGVNWTHVERCAECTESMADEVNP
jgi:hypothetical protein